MPAFKDEDRLLLIPGPTPVAREILEALALPTISHTSPQLATTIKDALKRLRDIAGSSKARVFVFAGSGTLAQEAALVNFVGPNDRVLVASNGYFGDRLHAIAEQYGLNSSLRQAKWGTSLTPKQLDDAIKETKTTVVAFTHVETSTGAMAPLPEFMEVIRRHGALSIVDGVAAFGGVPEPMDELGIDVLLTGAQKALGVPPGLAIIAVRPEAWKRRLARTDRLPGYYLDLVRWEPIMEQPDKYFSTHPVNLMQALACGLEVIEAEGLEERFERHERLANHFREMLGQIGFEAYTDPAYLAPTMSAFRTPSSLSASEFLKRLRLHGVVAAAGLEDKKDRVVRFGHMGNLAEAKLGRGISAIRFSVEGAHPDESL